MNHIYINDKYYISFPDLKITDDLKDKKHYLENPKAFLTRFTDLSEKDIDEILSDKELTISVIDSIYNKLDITKESTFISKVNKAYSTFNKVDMIFLMPLCYTFKFPIIELINKSTKDLIMLFIISSQVNKESELVVENVCDNLRNFYSEKTVEDFKKLCITEKTKEEQANDWNEEFSQFSQL